MLPHNVLLHLCPRREAQGKRAGDKQCFLLQMNETNVHTQHLCHCLNTNFTSPGCMGRCTNCRALYQTLSWNTPQRAFRMGFDGFPAHFPLACALIPMPGSPGLWEDPRRDPNVVISSCSSGRTVAEFLSRGLESALQLKVGAVVYPEDASAT